LNDITKAKAASLFDVPTRALFRERLGNPARSIGDIERCAS